ncbi:MAG: hypothetical protein IGS03_15845 [Candidatus Sericytochromatia bacterium]|nr:hypothetical protein [Candidatus Sericytochromatia bacterium]
MAKTCPHCNHEIPAGMEVMPVCVMCGGDINAQPTQTWTTLDIQNQGQQSYSCHACGAAIASVLTTECPSCGVTLELAKTSGSSAPEPVAPAPEPVAPEPVAPAPEPVAPAPEPVAPAPAPVSLPDFVEHPTPETRPEPVAPAPASRTAEPVKSAAPEGFFAKILRMLGLKK